MGGATASGCGSTCRREHPINATMMAAVANRIPQPYVTLSVTSTLRVDTIRPDMAKTAARAKMGRPLKGEHPRTRMVTMRLSDDEYARVKAACDLRGGSLADFVVAAADRELRNTKSA
jgi:hypothetical protein